MNYVDKKLLSTSGYLSEVVLNEKQFTKFLNKLNCEKIDDLYNLLYLNSYSPEREKLVYDLLKKVVDYLENNKIVTDEEEESLIDNIEIFNNNELYFLYSLYETGVAMLDNPMTDAYETECNYYSHCMDHVYKTLVSRHYNKKRAKVKKRVY